MIPENIFEILVEQYSQYEWSVKNEAQASRKKLKPNLTGFMRWISVSLTADVEQDENGHDVQCSSGIGAKCDCWRKETLYIYE